MANLKRLEKQRRKAAVRAARLCIEMQVAFEEKFNYEKLINEIKRKKKPDPLFAKIAAMKAKLERFQRAARKGQTVRVG